MKRSRNRSTTALDNPPVVVKRKTNIRASPNLRPQSNSQASKSACQSISTPPATPKSVKKRVRLSDTESEVIHESASSGITPIVNRALQITPSLSCDGPVQLSGIVQFRSIRQMLNGRAKRRLGRNGLSEKVNDIEWEDRQKIKFLQAEVRRLKTELEAKCKEIQIIKDKEELNNEEKLGDSATTDMELNARIQELEQHIKNLKAEFQQKEIEPGNFEDADSVLASRDFLSLDEDDGQAVTINDALESIINDDVIDTSAGLDTSLPSPPRTIPNTPSKGSNSKNARPTKRRQGSKFVWALQQEF